MSLANCPRGNTPIFSLGFFVLFRFYCIFYSPFLKYILEFSLDDFDEIGTMRSFIGSVFLV